MHGHGEIVRVSADVDEAEGEREGTVLLNHCCNLIAEQAVKVNHSSSTRERCRASRRPRGVERCSRPMGAERCG
jgi:hypothetical protein